MQLFEVYERKCMDEGKEDQKWEDIKEIEFVDMKDFKAAEIDKWLNDRGFLHKEMYRTDPSTYVEVKSDELDLNLEDL